MVLPPVPKMPVTAESERAERLRKKGRVDGGQCKMSGLPDFLLVVV